MKPIFEWIDVNDDLPPVDEEVLVAGEKRISVYDASGAWTGVSAVSGVWPAKLRAARYAGGGVRWKACCLARSPAHRLTGYKAIRNVTHWGRKPDLP